MEKAFIMIGALALSPLAGLVRPAKLQNWLDMPAAGLRSVARKLNREHRSVEERIRRGYLLTALALCAALAVGWLVGWLLPPTLEALLAAFAFPLAASWQRAGAVRAHLQAGNVQAARDALAGTVFRHHALLDAHGAARAGIEYLAVQFAEKIIAPVFWFLLLGMPGLFMSITISALQENLCGAASEPAPFGKAAHKAHGLLQYIPSRLAAMLWMVAVLFLPAVKWQEVSQRIYAGMHSEPPLRLVLLSAASATSTTLGGPSSAYCNDRWVGAGAAKADARDVAKARLLCALAMVFWFALVAFAALF